MEDFFRFISLDALSPMIPSQNLPLGINHEDRILFNAIHQSVILLFALTKLLITLFKNRLKWLH